MLGLQVPHIQTRRHGSVIDSGGTKNAATAVIVCSHGRLCLRCVAACAVRSDTRTADCVSLFCSQVQNENHPHNPMQIEKVLAKAWSDVTFDAFHLDAVTQGHPL